MAKGTYEELADDPYLKEIVTVHSEQVASYKVENHLNGDDQEKV